MSQDYRFWKSDATTSITGIIYLFIVLIQSYNLSNVIHLKEK